MMDYMIRQMDNPPVIAAKIREIEIRTANILNVATLAAQLRMAADINTITLDNNQAHDDNARIVPVLEYAAGAPSSLGDDEDAWRGWWFDTLGYSFQASPDDVYPRRGGAVTLPYSVGTCFAAGTPVHGSTEPARSRDPGRRSGHQSGCRNGGASASSRSCSSATRPPTPYGCRFLTASTLSSAPITDVRGEPSGDVQE